MSPSLAPVPFTATPSHPSAALFPAWRDDETTAYCTDAPTRRVQLRSPLFGWALRYDFGAGRGGVVALVTRCGRVLALDMDSDLALQARWRQEVTAHMRYARRPLGGEVVARAA